MFSKSIAELNYGLWMIRNDSLKRLYQTLLPKSNILILNSTLIFKNIEIFTDSTLKSDPLIKVIGEDVSSVIFEKIQMTISIPLLLNCVPASLSLLDSKLILTNSPPYLINSKHT
jgi:hypothetical protein